MHSPRSHLYFAYGSNLDVGQMRERCPGARVEVRGRLLDHRLLFAGHSRKWQGAVATIAPAANLAVPGLVYELGADDLEALDRHEGFPRTYDRKLVTIECDGERTVNAVSYYLVTDSVPGQPSPAYLRTIEAAYRKWGFDVRTLLDSP